jgi:phage baseplate assembly protein W
VPLERVSQGFKDISATFQISPINSDLISLKNSNAIARSIRNLVFTIPGDKPFQPTIGSRVSELLFENFDRLTATLIRGEIENTINDYEPRVKLKRVTVEPNFDNNEFNVSIRYNIIGIDIPVQQLTFILEPTR